MVARANVVMDNELSLGEAINYAKKVFVRVAGTNFAVQVSKKLAWDMGKRYRRGDEARYNELVPEWSWVQCDMDYEYRVILIYPSYDKLWAGKSICIEWRDGNRHFVLCERGPSVKVETLLGDAMGNE